MKKFIIATAFLAMGAATFSAPATAAPIRAEAAVTTTLDVTKAQSSSRKHWHKQPQRTRYLSTRQIVRQLSRQGYRDISRVQRNNGRYYAVARGYRGTVKLTVSARTGQVISRQLVRQHRGQGYRGQRNGFSFSYSIR